MNFLEKIEFIKSSLSHAIINKDMEKIREIMTIGNYPHYDLSDNKTLLSFALDFCTFYYEKEELSLQLIKMGADVTFWEHAAIINIISTNKFELLKYCLNIEGVNKNFYCDSLPYGFVGEAASLGNLNILKYLTSLGCDIHLWEDGAFRYACANGYLDCAKHLQSLDNMKLFSESSMAIFKIIDDDNLEMFEYMFNQVPPYWPEGVLILNKLCCLDSKISKFIFNKGIVPYDNKGFINAINYNNVFVIQKLLENQQWLNRDSKIQLDALINTFSNTLSGDKAYYYLKTLNLLDNKLLQDNDYYNKLNSYYKLQESLPLGKTQIIKKI